MKLIKAGASLFNTGYGLEKKGFRNEEKHAAVLEECDILVYKALLLQDNFFEIGARRGVFANYIEKSANKEMIELLSNININNFSGTLIRDLWAKLISLPINRANKDEEREINKVIYTCWAKKLQEENFHIENANPEHIDRDTGKISPLLFAAGSLNIKAVKSCIENGENILIENKKGDSVFKVAVLDSLVRTKALKHQSEFESEFLPAEEIMELLARESCIQKILFEIYTNKKDPILMQIKLGVIERNYADIDKKTLLMHACEAGNIKAIEILLDENIYKLDHFIGGDKLIFSGLINAESININSKDKYGNTALMFSCKAKDIAIVEILLRNNADINAQNDDADTALSLACNARDTTIAALLLEYEPNVQNYDNDMELLLACKKKDAVTVDFLLENNANINIQNYDGDTPLLLSCKAKDAETVEFLLKNKADINIKNKNGDTALMISCKANDKESVVALLSEKQVYSEVIRGGGAMVKYQNLNFLDFEEARKSLRAVCKIMESKESMCDEIDENVKDRQYIIDALVKYIGDEDQDDISSFEDEVASVDLFHHEIFEIRETKKQKNNNFPLFEDSQEELFDGVVLISMDMGL